MRFLFQWAEYHQDAALEKLRVNPLRTCPANETAFSAINFAAFASKITIYTASTAKPCPTAVVLNHEPDQKYLLWEQVQKLPWQQSMKCCFDC